MTIAVSASPPSDMSGSVIFLRPFFLEHRLRSAVTHLLLPIGHRRVAPVMPDERGGIVSQRKALFLKAPTNVDVISRAAKPLVEAADLQQRSSTKSHIAARKMLRLFV